ncbi:hypothetical protein D7Z54_26995 [Salibacterium salarium]|uniref:Uncharacterized protein n=1 Tax=Salibacterium salarium TaxID=284579 RepID=A0A3R9WNN6_9BACI|nr:hypothetical protein [Salibacterium salarium]RSL30254.1 hypothetical protein D7Z54_26995 [Salibacterium salarium]
MTLIYQGEKDELKKNKRKIFHATATAFILAFAPTAAIAFVVFALFGSTTFANHVFSLDVSINQLMVLTVSIFIYLYTVDSLIEVIVKHLTETSIYSHITLLLIRILAFYSLGVMLGLNQTSNVIIAAAVSFIIFLIELLDVGNRRKENNE